MRRWLLQLSPALHLTRVSSAFAAVANVWFVILWTRAIPAERNAAASSRHQGMPEAELPATLGGLDPSAESALGLANLLTDLPLWIALIGSALNALGLFTFAMALNDVLDHRRDQSLHPERPIPSGRLTVDRAVTVVALSFGAAVLGATLLSMPSVVLTLLVAGAILFFNAAGKYVPAVGLVLLGLIYAGQMVTPNIELRFVWPVWLVMTHALAVAGLSHVIGRKVPAVSTRAIAFAVIGWVFWSVVILSFGYVRGAASPRDAGAGIASRERSAETSSGLNQSAASAVRSVIRSEGTLWPEWVNPWAWVAPAMLLVGFALLVWIRLRSLGPGQRAADKVSRYGALWLALYACAWLIGQQLWGPAWILIALTLAGFVGMTVLRELFHLLEHPITYRR